jgi:hypothetical protein
MISGVHVIIYSKDADADPAFFNQHEYLIKERLWKTIILI